MRSQGVGGRVVEGAGFIEGGGIIELGSPTPRGHAQEHNPARHTTHTQDHNAYTGAQRNAFSAERATHASKTKGGGGIR